MVETALIADTRFKTETTINRYEALGDKYTKDSKYLGRQQSTARKGYACPSLCTGHFVRLARYMAYRFNLLLIATIRGDNDLSVLTSWTD